MERQADRGGAGGGERDVRDINTTVRVFPGKSGTLYNRTALFSHGTNVETNIVFQMIKGYVWTLSPLSSSALLCRSVGGGQDDDGFYSHGGKKQGKDVHLSFGSRTSSSFVDTNELRQRGQGKLTFLPNPYLTSG